MPAVVTNAPRYRMVVRHGNPEARARHHTLGFTEGWSAVTDQLATLTQGVAARWRSRSPSS
jgi:hypothetical protein